MSYEWSAGADRAAFTIALLAAAAPCAAQSTADQLNRALLEGQPTPQVAAPPAAPAVPRASVPAIPPSLSHGPTPQDPARQMATDVQALRAQYQARFADLQARYRANPSPEARKAAMAEMQALRQEEATRIEQVRDNYRTQTVARREEWRQTCDQVAGWTANMPAQDAGGARLGQAPEADVMALIEDSRFQRALGKPYAQMSAEELKPYPIALGHCFTSTGPLAQLGVREKTAALTVLSALNMPRIQAAVARQQQTVRDLGEMSATLDNLQPTPADYDRLVSMTSRFTAAQARIPAQQRSAFQARLASAEERIAIPIERQRTQSAIALDKGPESLQAMASLQTQLSRTSPSQAVNSARGEDRVLLAKRISETASAVVAAEKSRIDSFGNGLPALEKGVAWNEDFRRRYDGAGSQVKELGELQSYFLDKRRAVLSTVAPSFQREIGKASDPTAVAGRYLLASDRNDPAGAALWAAVADRGMEQEKWAVLRSNPAQDRKSGGSGEGGSNAGNAGNRSSSGEPTEGDMYDAFNAHLRGATAALQGLADSCSNVRGSNNPADAVACLMGAAVKHSGGTQPMAINSFEKVGCMPASGRYGFNCDFNVAMSGGPIGTQALGRTFSGMASQSYRQHGLFTRDRSGHWSVELPETERGWR